MDQSHLLIISLIPLILFVALDYFASQKVAIIGAMVSALGIMLAFISFTATWNWSLFIEVLLICSLGGIALRLKNETFFKLQPAVVSVIFSIFLLWFQIFDEPYLAITMQRMSTLQPQLKQIMAYPGFQEMLYSVSWQLIGLLLIHTVFLIWSATKLNNLGWILVRLAIYPVFIVILISNQVIYLSPTTE